MSEIKQVAEELHTAHVAAGGEERFVDMLIAANYCQVYTDILTSRPCAIQGTSQGTCTHVGLFKSPTLTFGRGHDVGLCATHMARHVLRRRRWDRAQRVGLSNA